MLILIALYQQKNDFQSKSNRIFRSIHIDREGKNRKGQQENITIHLVIYQSCFAIHQNRRLTLSNQQKMTHIPKH